MDKYLCGVEALRYWHVPGVECLFQDITGIPSYLYSTYSKQRVKPDEQFSCTKIRNIRKYVVGNICKIELVFAQLAKYLNDRELIYLALQICSKVGDSRPLSDVKSLRRCVRNLNGFCDQNRIMRLLQYVKDRSFSPMESLMYMLLALPCRYGGAGFTDFEFNVRIDACKSIKRTMYGDLCHVPTKLICEYDSRTHHDNPYSYVEDNVRASILEENGWQVISVRFAQLHDPKLFRILCSNIAKRVGVRLRIRSVKYRDGYREIIRILERVTGFR